MRDLIGVSLGVYRLVEEIGQGAMSTVYKAYQHSLERWVAVKVLDPAYIGHDAESSARFKREARAIAALRHPNIVTVYDFGVQEGLEYIAMEYVAGGTLKTRLTGTPFDWKRAASLAIAIGQALAFAHSQGIIHRDIKPGNVLLPRDTWPLLADFGLAKIGQFGRGLTDPGVSLGTPAYVSPEQALGETVDHRADIYALGAVLFEMLTGRVPYSATRPFDVLLMHISEPIPRPRDMAPEVPELLEQIILTALEKDPANRYPQMMDMVADLESLAGTGIGTRPTEVAVDLRLTSAHPTAEFGGVRTLVRGPHFVAVGSGTTLPVPHQDEVLIGRSDPGTDTTVDIDLTAMGGVACGVSRQHARMVLTNVGWAIEDLRSTNGTLVNREIIPPFQPMPLHDGDQVDLGQLSLVFHIGEADT
jgi:tRNA A-37 threonylcarbamoyl transferase component Bud32